MRTLRRTVLPLALIAAYALLALGSGADRLGASGSGTSGPFASQAAHPPAAAALVEGRAELALHHGEAAVRADPLNPHAVGVLGAAALLTGEEDRAATVFRHSQRLGWRDIPTRVFAFEQAARAERWQVASRHAEALLLAVPDLPAGAAMLGRMAEREDGRDALAGLLRRHPDLSARHFAGPQVREPVLLARAGWMSAAGAPRLGCAAVRPLAERLLEQSFRGPAETLWQRQCNARPVPLIADARFAALASGRRTEPFGWTMQPSGDLTHSFARTKRGGIVLKASNAASTPRLLLTQAVALSPGEQRVRGEGVGRGGRFLLSLDCGDAARRPVSPVLTAGGQILRAAECENQTLGVWVRPGRGEARLGALELERP